jgi:hypothetical protein
VAVSNGSKETGSSMASSRSTVADDIIHEKEWTALFIRPQPQAQQCFALM